MKHYSSIEWLNLLSGVVNEEVECELHEHLLECEECLNIYVSLIENAEETHLNSPLSLDFTDRVMNTIHEENRKLQAIKKRKTFNNLIICYVSAACITLFFMSSGIFDFLSKKIPESSTKFSTTHLGSSNLLSNGWTDRLVDKTSSFVNGFTKNK
ncbi:MAG: hypothetical protein K0R09_1086 [Clostridiales bacterium]|jgi:hypothetical protein|nr:hypothetical protein [Clostridiales bacterium]